MAEKELSQSVEDNNLTTKGADDRQQKLNHVPPVKQIKIRRPAQEEDEKVKTLDILENLHMTVIEVCETSVYQELQAEVIYNPTVGIGAGLIPPFVTSPEKSVEVYGVSYFVGEPQSNFNGATVKLYSGGIYIGQKDNVEVIVEEC